MKERGLKMDRPDGRRVRKFDGPSGRGLWWRLRRRLKERGAASAAGCVEGLHRFAQGATAPAALRVVDCPSGNTYKVSVTGLAFSVIWHDKHSADWLAALATPYPAAPDFPLCRGQNKTPRIILFISGALLSPCRRRYRHIYDGAESAVPRQRSDTI